MLLDREERRDGGREGRRERGRERKRRRKIDAREKHQLAASHMPPTGHLACNPGMSPDWESNQ